MSGVVVLVVRVVQEPGVPAGGGAAEAAGHCVLQHPGIQPGKEAQHPPQALRRHQDQLLGDPVRAHPRLHILRHRQLPHPYIILRPPLIEPQPLLPGVLTRIHVDLCAFGVVALCVCDLLQFCVDCDGGLRGYYWSQLSLRCILFVVICR